MNDVKLRVLIADSHYLIAMDLERILSESGFCDVQLCAMPALNNRLMSDRYHVVMLDSVGSETINVANAELAGSTGARVAFLTTMDDFQTAYPSLAHYAVLQKPFDPDSVIALTSQFRDEVFSTSSPT